MRRRYTTSALGSTESRSWLTCTGQPVRFGGRSVGGATSVTSAPSPVKASTLERATRECFTSPTMAIRNPASEPRDWRIV